jgi:hypothetical protein
MSRPLDLFDRLVKGGEPEVLSFIAQPVTEELFLDYKRSANDGSGTSLDNRDRTNLAKAISGFGNSEGGVILWGVDCRNDPVRGDVPTGPVRIQQPPRFKSWLEQATTGLTIPPHGGVRHHAIPEGFVVSLIPSGMHAPYQSVSDFSYYIRSGSNFARTPHAVLAGLFGRRPQPSIKHHYFVDSEPRFARSGAISTQIGLVLYNYGLGIAEDIFVNSSITSHPGRLCEIQFMPSEEQDVWRGNLVLEQKMQMISRAGVRLAPEAGLMPISLRILLQNPIERDFAFEGICGSTGAETWRFQFSCNVATIIDATNQLLRTPPDAPDFPRLARRFNTLFYESVPGAGGEPS